MRKLERKHRRPAELLLVPMIDIFTVLVTFLLMTAVFSRTVILELKLPTNNPSFVEPPAAYQKACKVEVAEQLVWVSLDCAPVKLFRQAQVMFSAGAGPC